VRISEIFSSVTSAYDDWSKFLTNPQHLRIGNAVAWSSFAPFILDYPVLSSDVVRMTDDGQYTLQVIEDGSIIQIYYLYNRKEDQILSANLAFYSIQISERPSIHDIELDEVGSSAVSATSEDGEAIENLPMDEIVSGNEDGPVSWLRIDYDPQNARGVLHHACHLHISAFPDSRFVVSGLPTPKQFIEFIMALCYPMSYKEHRLNEQWEYGDEKKIRSVNQPCVTLEDSDIYRQIAHFRVPDN
jgi:hypothetical protein